MLRPMLQQITEEFWKGTKNLALKKNEDLVQIRVIIASHNFSPDYTLH